MYAPASRCEGHSPVLLAKRPWSSWRRICSTVCAPTGCAAGDRPLHGSPFSFSVESFACRPHSRKKTPSIASAPYPAMPGLKLTVPQAVRWWGVGASGSTEPGLAAVTAGTGLNPSPFAGRAPGRNHDRCYPTQQEPVATRRLPLLRDGNRPRGEPLVRTRVCRGSHRRGREGETAARQLQTRDRTRVPDDRHRQRESEGRLSPAQPRRRSPRTFPCGRSAQRPLP